jgi:hypothetical protein
MNDTKLISIGQGGMRFSEHYESLSMFEKREKIFIKRLDLTSLYLYLMNFSRQRLLGSC